MSDKRTARAPAPRGRGAPTRQRGISMPIFYAVLVLITIGGVILVLNNTQVLRESALADQRSRPIASSIPLESLPARGLPNAPVTVIEYADFQCPACQVFAGTIEPGIVRDYIDTGKLRFIYHDFPLSQHKNAVPAAEAARCAGAQNAYWPMHDLLYAQQAEWQGSGLPGGLFAGYADQLRLDRGAFDACMSGHTYRAEIQAAGQAALKSGINATPTFVIDGKSYTMDQLRGAIDAALAAKP